jgi:hypothetical protein
MTHAEAAVGLAVGLRPFLALHYNSHIVAGETVVVVNGASVGI